MMKKPHRRSALIPLLTVTGGDKSGVCHRRDEFEHTALGSIGLFPRPALGHRLVMVAPHDDTAKVKAKL
jgi:hypothetical protein